MATLRGLALGQLDPAVLALRSGYVAWHDRFVQQWHTERNAARWAEERRLWLDGEPMLCTTEQVFFAAVEAGEDERPFTHTHDPRDERLWLLPGAEGGPLAEVAFVDDELQVIGPPDEPRTTFTASQIARMGGNARRSAVR